MKLEPGDVVRLISSPMTVEQITSNEDVHCAWYEGAEIRRGTFHISTLTKTGTGEHVRFISEEEDENPSGVDGYEAATDNHARNRPSLAKTTQDTIRAFSSREDQIDPPLASLPLR